MIFDDATHAAADIVVINDGETASLTGKISQTVLRIAQLYANAPTRALSTCCIDIPPVLSAAVRPV